MACATLSGLTAGAAMTMLDASAGDMPSPARAMNMSTRSRHSSADVALANIRRMSIANDSESPDVSCGLGSGGGIVPCLRMRLSELAESGRPLRDEVDLRGAL